MINDVFLKKLSAKNNRNYQDNDLSRDLSIRTSKNMVKIGLHNMNYNVIF